MSPTVRIVSIALACAFLAGGSVSYQAQVQPQARPEQTAGMAAEAVERGRLLASTACASCHATGATGPSPMADATPFREIVRRYPLDHLEEAFAEGLVTAHPAMPDHIFRASEIDDLIAWLETLKAEQ